MLVKARFVDELAPQAEWRLIHRIADAAYPRVYSTIVQALAKPIRNDAFTRQMNRLRNNDPVLALTAADFDPLADALNQRVWPLLWRTYVRAGQLVAQTAGRRGLLRKARRKQPQRAGLALSFNETNPLAQQWAREQSATLVTRIVQETQEGIQAIIHEAFAAERHPYQIARDLMQLKGLGITKPHAIALLKKRDRWIADGLSSAEIQKRVQAQYNFYLRYRAEMIARTEVLHASNAGQMGAWQQGRSQGLIDPDLVKEWIYTPDRRFCPICEKLNGEQREVDQAFSIGLMQPPAHPHCRCAIGLVPPRDAASQRRPADEILAVQSVGPEALQSVIDDVEVSPERLKQAQDTIAEFARDDKGRIQWPSDVKPQDVLNTLDPRAAQEMDRLFAMIPEANSQLRDVLGMLEALLPDASISHGPPKGMARAVEKVVKYKGDVRALRDPVRASISVNRYNKTKEVVQAIDRVLSEVGGSIVGAEDRFTYPTSSGYRDLNLNVRLRNGVVGEIQVHLNSILQVKNGPGHVLYVQERVIRERGSLSRQDKARIAAIQAQARSLYDPAWKKAGGR